ncbi:MAG TPA: sigma 54-interacting transcriptional regulator [Kofleriaceae bacterium]
MIDNTAGEATDRFEKEAPFGDRVLLVIDGAALQVAPLPGTGTLSVGRSAKCDVVIDSGSVSRHHANLHIGPDVEIEDIGSSNGTTVDGVKIAPEKNVKLQLGVPFLVGAVTLMVQTRAGTRRETAAQSSQLAALEQSAARIAVGKLPVLVVGEIGVGKERFAERVHTMSPRRPGPFVRVNCSAVSESVLEAEMFGTDVRAGLLESADGGSVLLSDVDALPAGIQHKLFRVLEDGEVRRMNSAKARAVDLRFVATTSKDLNDMVDGNMFRRDLYFRLAGATFVVPPLRERKDEVIPLAEQFIASAAGPLGRAFTLSDEAKQWLSSHEWPGNIRELRNACERAVLLATGSEIELHHLTITSDEALRRGPQGRRSSPTIPPPMGIKAPSAADMPTQVRATVAELEKQRILEALERCAGNQTRAAEQLGISRRTLINRLDEYGIARPRKREE